MTRWAEIGGERVEVLGPKPEGWKGLGESLPNAVLVRYPPTGALPEGEIGAVAEVNLTYEPEESS